jgi:proteic killer suppression protein
VADVAGDEPVVGAGNWGLHPLKGDLKGIRLCVCGKWRLTFRFECEDAVLVDYLDYH